MQTINKIRFSFSMLMSLLVLIGLNTAFVACDDDDDEGFYLESFGPSPVMRGDTLTFIGKQLNKVSSVVFENGTEVTSVNFDGNGKFFIVVPEEAQSGYLTLKTTSGDYKTLTKLGVTDPAKVTRGALENAASIAAMILTTEALITDIPEPEGAAPAMPQGGGMY